MRTKTQLWRGGIAAIVREAKERLPDSDFLREAPPLPLPEPGTEPSSSDSQSADAAHAPALPPRPQRPLGSTTLVGHAFDMTGERERAAGVPATKRPELHATRLVPIESLLAKPSDSAAAAAVPPRSPCVEASTSESPPEPDPSLAERAAAPRDLLRIRPTGAQLRRGLMVVLALAAVVLFALPKPSAPPAMPARTSVAAPAQPTRVVVRTDEAAVATPGRLAEGTSVTPRQAVDALASGDYAAAQRLYVQLARASGNGAVYAEAARILDERIRSRSY